MELAGAIKDEFLTCNICLEGYTKPKQLPCLHTFCRTCLSRYIARTVGVSGVLRVPCPLCRQVTVPPDPDPRKLNEWADQFPDNFFIASLIETVEARKKRSKRDATEDDHGDDSSSQSTTYFMGSASSCPHHLTNPMTIYCLGTKSGVCQDCLQGSTHQNCAESQHLDAESARDSATELLEKYQDQISTAKHDIEEVKYSFSRKPRRLQSKKDEVEIAIGDYFSELRSVCARMLLSKEREMVDRLSKVVELESGRTDSCQKACEDIKMSLNNTITLFDTLTQSGPFNALHVLNTVDEQIARLTRLTAKLGKEAKADNLRFQPPDKKVDEHIANLDLGGIVADFGKGEKLVQGVYDEGSTEEGSTGHLEALLSELRLTDVCDDDSSPSQSGARAETPSEGRESYSDYSDSESQNPQPSAPAVAAFDESLISPYPLETERHRPEFSDTGPTPSAPPIAQAPEIQAGASAAQAAAYQRAVRRELKFEPLMVFSGNIPSERRSGGLCGAAMVDQLNRAAFVDRLNQSVKIVDLHYAQIVGYVSLQQLEPYDITLWTTSKKLVVTCPAQRYLLFIPTDCKDLKVSHHVATSTGYSCIAYLSEDRFAVGVCAPFGPSKVSIISWDGKPVHEILPGSFTYPRTIFANPAGSLIVVSDWTANVVTLVTSEGELVCRYRDAPGPKGVAISQETELLHVLDGKWGRLHVLDVKGQCVASGKLAGCRDPRMVVLVPIRSSHFVDPELCVVADGKNALHIMTLGSNDSYSQQEAVDDFGYSYDYGYDYNTVSSTV